jgi:hypothetical protein
MIAYFYDKFFIDFIFCLQILTGRAGELSSCVNPFNTQCIVLCVFLGRLRKILKMVGNAKKNGTKP